MSVPRGMTRDVGPLPDKVYFRKYKKPWQLKNGSDHIVAVFPENIATTNGYVTTYEHIGQHGAANEAHLLNITKEAKPQEYAELKKELERRGYVLIVLSGFRS